MTTQDFIITNHGTVWNIRAVSEAAKEAANELFDTIEPWMGTTNNFTTDWRAARDLCEQLDADGFSIGRA